MQYQDYRRLWRYVQLCEDYYEGPVLDVGPTDFVPDDCTWAFDAAEAALACAPADAPEQMAMGNTDWDSYGWTEADKAALDLAWDIMLGTG